MESEIRPEVLERYKEELRAYARKAGYRVAASDPEPVKPEPVELPDPMVEEPAAVPECPDPPQPEPVKPELEIPAPVPDPEDPAESEPEAPAPPAAGDQGPLFPLETEGTGCLVGMEIPCGECGEGDGCP